MGEETKNKSIISSYILNGVVIMLLSTLIFFYTGAALMFIIYLFTFIILISGIARVNASFNNQKLSNIGKATKFVSGFVLIVLSFGIFIITLGDPTFSTDVLIFFLTIGLVIIGIARVGTGVVNKEYIKWFRILLIIVGMVTIVLSLSSIVFMDVNITIYLLTTALFINGFTRFLYGVIF
ncbi:MAG: DUF308 domain-containing protein [Candidatus Hermodarchaeota archaeon]